MAFDTVTLSSYCYVFTDVASSEVMCPIVTGNEIGEGKYTITCLFCLPTYLKGKGHPIACLCRHRGEADV